MLPFFLMNVECNGIFFYMDGHVLFIHIYIYVTFITIGVLGLDMKGLLRGQISRPAWN